jgi:sugar/nucleoside kinase (ribokinase family)
MMTLEEQIEDLRNQVEATNSKNSELLKELRIAKNKTKELDFDTYNKTIEENEQLKETLSKLDKNSKTEIEKLSKNLTDKDSKLKQILVVDGLRDALIKAGADVKLMDGALALNKDKVMLDDTYTPSIGGKDLNTFATEWLGNEGSGYRKFEETSGGSSNGSGNGATVPKETTVDASKHKDASSFMSEAFNSLTK